jgi:soluble lytic murein transglycosylase-like protein
MDLLILGAVVLSVAIVLAAKQAGAAIKVAAVNLNLPDVLAPFADKIMTEAQRNSIDPYLIAAIIMTESSGNPNAENVSGREASIGLMQVNTIAHREYDRVKLKEPDYNIEAGSTVLATSIGYAARRVRPDDALRVAVAGYNAGDGTAVRWYNLGQDVDSAYTSKVARNYSNMVGSAPW